MPKDEFDFDDPFELNGRVFLTQEDTTRDMAECFIEEFQRLGYSAPAILALFHQPRYLGPNLAMEKLGEPFIRELVAEVFARRGKQVTWAEAAPSGQEETPSDFRIPHSAFRVAVGVEPSAATAEADPLATDPTGAPIPQLNP
jgi:hypothetical protein